MVCVVRYYFFSLHPELSERHYKSFLDTNFLTNKVILSKLLKCQKKFNDKDLIPSVHKIYSRCKTDRNFNKKQYID